MLTQVRGQQKKSVTHLERFRILIKAPRNLKNTPRRPSVFKVLIQIHFQLPQQNPALDMSHDDDHGEISGEFGDNISMSSRGPEITHDIHAPPLPPDDEMATTCSDHFAILKSHHMKALIWKNFLWMWRNFG